MNEDVDETREVPMIQKVASILWPSFITAGIATSLFFTAFDPVEMLACQGYPDISRTGAYSIGFFLFWLVTSSSCFLTSYFLKPCALVNQTKAP